MRSLFCLSFSVFSLLSAAAFAQDKNGDGLIGNEDVVVERADEATKETSYTDLYSLKGFDGCEVFWRFEKGNAEYPDDRIMYDGTVDCTDKSFKEAIPLHQTVLSTIESKEDLSKLSSVILFGFVSEEGDNSWSLPIAQASATDAGYQKIAGKDDDAAAKAFIRIANATDAYEDLQVALFIIGKKADLTEVNEVKQSKFSEYGSKDKLTDIEDDPWVLHDAGYTEFSISAQTGLPKSLQSLNE